MMTLVLSCIISFFIGVFLMLIIAWSQHYNFKKNCDCIVTEEDLKRIHSDN